MCQVSVSCCHEVPPLLPAAQLLTCRVALLSPDLPWWEVSPFKCPFPEQHVPDSPRTGGLSALSSGVLQHPGPSRWESLSPCASVGFFWGGGGGGQFCISVPPSLVPELSHCCPKLLSTPSRRSRDIGSSRVSGIVHCLESVGHLQIWPADLESLQKLPCYQKRKKCWQGCGECQTPPTPLARM